MCALTSSNHASCIARYAAQATGNPQAFDPSRVAASQFLRIPRNVSASAHASAPTLTTLSACTLYPAIRTFPPIIWNGWLDNAPLHSPIRSSLTAG